ncbi:MAG: hypothetical protein IJC53_00280 [Clostridia bacterium]|nr:hypothetical protein [Clostridia bacterium]
MRNALLRLCAVLLLAAVLICSLAGCSSLEQTMLVIDGHTVTRGMFNYFVYQASDYYVTNYLGEGEVLDPRQEYDGRTLGDMIIDHACRQIANEYAMLRLGAEHGITLSDENIAEAREELVEFKKEYGSDLLSQYYEEYNMTEEDYVQIYALFNLEDSIQEALFGEDGPHYPDENKLDEFRKEFADGVYHVQYVMLNDRAAGQDNIKHANAVRELLMEKDADIEEIVDTYSLTADANNANDVYLSPDGDITESALAVLPVGSVSEVLHVDEYYYIFVQLESKESDYVGQMADAYVNELMIEMIDEAVEKLEVEETAAYRNYNFEQR